MQFVRFDGHRHVVDVESHRHVELEIRSDVDILGGRRGSKGRSEWWVRAKQQKGSLDLSG